MGEPYISVFSQGVRGSSTFAGAGPALIHVDSVGLSAQQQKLVVNRCLEISGHIPERVALRVMTGTMYNLILKIGIAQVTRHL